MSDAQKVGSLAWLKRATKARDLAHSRADAAWYEAIRQAHADGSSLRVIADHAGVSHVRVLQIVRTSSEPMNSQ